MTKFDSFFLGFVLSLMVTGYLAEYKIRPTAKKNGYEQARIEALNKMVDLPFYYTGFDQTYDLGFQKCQDIAFDQVSGMKYREKN